MPEVIFKPSQNFTFPYHALIQLLSTSINMSIQFNQARFMEATLALNQVTKIHGFSCLEKQNFYGLMSFQRRILTFIF